MATGAAFTRMCGRTPLATFGGELSNLGTAIQPLDVARYPPTGFPDQAAL